MDAHHPGAAAAQFPHAVPELQHAAGHCGHGGLCLRSFVVDHRMGAVRGHSVCATGPAPGTPIEPRRAGAIRPLAAAAARPVTVLGMVPELFFVAHYLARPRVRGKCRRHDPPRDLIIKLAYTVPVATTAAGSPA